MTGKTSTNHATVFALEDAASAIASARRAALADRYAASSFAAEWRRFDELEPVADAWRELAASSLEPNVFYEPAFALAAAGVFGRDAGAVLIWSGTSPRRLLGFFPARIETRRYGIKLPVLVGWTHSYAPLGMPLVAREAAEPVLAAFLAHLAADQALPGLWLVPFLPERGAFAETLDAIVRRAQIPAADFNRHERALLAPVGERSHYVEQALGARKRKELGRVARRLSELGAVLFTSATNPAAVAAATEDFLALEARGWKGRAGTAAAEHDELRRFMRTAVDGLAAEGKVSVARILLDGRAIAAAIVLRSGRNAWFWKTAYDEGLARFSPGVMLTVALTEELCDDASITQADSCATSDHPMIDHIWRERLALGDRLVAALPQVPFAQVRRLEMLRSAAIASARSIRDRLRGELKRVQARSSAEEQTS